MNWWQAFLLGIVQGLTEFLPVSSSAHLMIFRDLFGASTEGFLDFTVTVHLATVLSTLVVFRSVILELFKGFFQFRYNDQTDYVCKIAVSVIPVLVMGLFFKDSVEALFEDSLTTVAACLLVTAGLLVLSDFFGKFTRRKADSKAVTTTEHRNGISYSQALIVGIGQACAVAPGLSRSGTTIAMGLVSGVRRDVMAQFSFLMVLVPILGEQFLEILGAITEPSTVAAGVGFLPLLAGFVAAFLSGLFACKVMISLVRKARLSWFALYCVTVAILLFIFA